MKPVMTKEKVHRDIKRTERAFVYGGLLLSSTGAIFTFILSRPDLGKPHIIPGVILVGIGALAGCILKVYERLDQIEQKLDKLSEK